MNKYNLFYRTDKEIIEKKNMTKEELQDFLDKIEVEEKSELKVFQVKDRDEEEER